MSVDSLKEMITLTWTSCSRSITDVADTLHQYSAAIVSFLYFILPSSDVM